METGGEQDPENAVGDGGDSIGPYQIQYGYWLDATEEDPSLKANGRTWQNTKGAGSQQYSEKVMQAYMNRYATKRRLNGRKPTDEDIARIHNGGPNGYSKPTTVAYWNKVKKNLIAKKNEL